MATTTPNYGWSVPTSTDYVKDGATAIETLGDAIDASFGSATFPNQIATTYSSVTRPIPFATQANIFAIGALGAGSSTTVSVTYPTSRFNQTPVYFASAGEARYSIGMSSHSTASITFVIANFTAASGAASTGQSFSVQMKFNSGIG